MVFKKIIRTDPLETMITVSKCGFNGVIGKVYHLNVAILLMYF